MHTQKIIELQHLSLVVFIVEKYVKNILKNTHCHAFKIQRKYAQRQKCHEHIIKSHEMIRYTRVFIFVFFFFTLD